MQLLRTPSLPLPPSLVLPPSLFPPFLPLSFALSLLSYSPSFSTPSLPLRLSLPLSLPLLPFLLCSLPLGTISRPPLLQTSRQNNACTNACTLTHIQNSDPAYVTTNRFCNSITIMELEVMFPVIYRNHQFNIELPLVMCL